MNPIRKLASQTAVYGLSSIVGRLLNYLLVPLHTRVFLPGEYGVVTEMYSYVAFLLVVLTYGFETAFFRYAGKEYESSRVYSTAQTSLFTSSVLFVGVCWLFSGEISSWIQYPDHPEYVVWFALILAFDAVTAIPFTKLRLENKPFVFAGIKLVNIGVNVLANLFFLLLCPYVTDNPGHFLYGVVLQIYTPAVGVGYVFIANLLASLVTLLLLLPGMLRSGFRNDLQLWKRMMRYGFPLLIGGLAGITNEMFSRVSMKYQLDPEIAMHELGVFGACYKVAVLMTIFIQTFRFAAEPFFFSHAREKDSTKLYAEVMTWFVVACSFIYLFVLLFMNIARELIGENYYEGLGVVPILLMANVFLGIFYNLSIWFKLKDKTVFGAWLSIFGAVLTIVLNYFLIPAYGYYGASWATFIVYFSMMLVSYYLGKKYYPVPYEIARIIFYPLGAALVALAYPYFLPMEGLLSWILKVLILAAFAGLVYQLEVRKKRLISP
ncbi:MAG: polysaccharide biosynthesis C-terminal domain-containing protein [Bacteroidetes bacterium]|nr:polysaccharide biosynthesis C-terminal domain-containing protein [Bacteroidota bacterium]